MNVSAAITHAAAVPDLRATADPSGRCCADGERALSNAEFDQEVRRVAKGLAGHGVAPGVVVATLEPNSVDFVVLMFAVWRCGAVLTPINPALTAEEVAFQLRDSAARLLVTRTAPSSLETQVATFDELTDVEVADDELAGGPSASHVLENLALLIYTSGTTAQPKGVMLTHANLAAMTSTWIAWLDVTPRDRCLLFLPLFHVNAIMVSVLGPLWAGGSIYIQPRFELETFWDVVGRERPTYFSAVPTILTALVDSGRHVRAPSLRFVGCGAAPASSALLASFESQFSIAVIEGYGLTECTVAATINPLRGERKPGTVGLPLPGVEVAIATQQGYRKTRDQGEIVVRGATVMRGYLGMPEVTRETIRNGWLHTGDVGYFDQDGYLVLTDRVKDMVIWGGENISSAEVEGVLASHPDVSSASVVGRSHPRYGEEPVAFVVPAPGAVVDVDALLEFAGQRIARFKVPRAIWVVLELPTNAVGKVLKAPLREKANIGTKIDLL